LLAVPAVCSQNSLPVLAAENQSLSVAPENLLQLQIVIKVRSLQL
jgi:hypothetical protein